MDIGHPKLKISYPKLKTHEPLMHSAESESERRVHKLRRLLSKEVPFIVGSLFPTLPCVGCHTKQQQLSQGYCLLPVCECPTAALLFLCLPCIRDRHNSQNTECPGGCHKDVAAWMMQRRRLALGGEEEKMTATDDAALVEEEEKNKVTMKTVGESAGRVVALSPSAGDVGASARSSLISSSGSRHRSHAMMEAAPAAQASSSSSLIHSKRARVTQFAADGAAVLHAGDVSLKKQAVAASYVEGIIHERKDANEEEEDQEETPWPSGEEAEEKADPIYTPDAAAPARRSRSRNRRRSRPLAAAGVDASAAPEEDHSMGASPAVAPTRTSSYVSYRRACVCLTASLWLHPFCRLLPQRRTETDQDVAQPERQGNSVAPMEIEDDDQVSSPAVAAAAAAATPRARSHRNDMRDAVLLALPALLVRCEQLATTVGAGDELIAADAEVPKLLTIEQCDAQLDRLQEQLARGATQAFRQRWLVGQCLQRRFSLWMGKQPRVGTAAILPFFTTSPASVRSAFVADVVACRGGSQHDRAQQHLKFAHLCDIFSALVFLPQAAAEQKVPMGWTLLESLLRKQQLHNAIERHMQPGNA